MLPVDLRGWYGLRSLLFALTYAYAGCFSWSISLEHLATSLLLYLSTFTWVLHAGVGNLGQQFRVFQTSLYCLQGNEVKETKSFIVPERSNQIVMHI